MKPNIYIITLAVDDLDRSLAFYQDGLGLGQATHGGDHILFELQGELTLVLLLRTEFDKTAGQTDTSGDYSSISLSYQADSKQEVDEILQMAVSSGGSLPSEPQEHDWGYNGYFKDPDGHLWEIAYFNS
ncbi:VOC family protein [Aerococcaceae bacterium DSM 111176]|nr:VOC family protein [Aerococcaceae bacterium DSM 111176]